MRAPVSSEDSVVFIAWAVSIEKYPTHSSRCPHSGHRPGHSGWLCDHDITLRPPKQGGQFDIPAFLTHSGSLCDLGHFCHDRVHSRPPALYIDILSSLLPHTLSHQVSLSLGFYLRQFIIRFTSHGFIYANLWHSVVCSMSGRLSLRLSSSFD